MNHFTKTLGHEEAKARLSAAVMHQSVSHAYLFEGIRGVGKRTLASDFAKMLLCTEPQVSNRACGRCLSCRRIESGNHPDVIDIRREGKASVGVGQIRQLIKNTMYIRPLLSEWKIYIIEDGETLTAEAQNALLKTLEEPPAYAVLMILAEDSQAFLPTVLSRVQKIKLNPLDQAIVEQGLIRDLKIPGEQARLIAHLSRGSIGEGKKLAESTDFQIIRSTMTQWLERFYTMKASEVLGMSEFFQQYKDKQQALQQEMIFSLMETWFHDVLIFQTTCDESQLINQDRLAEIRKTAGDMRPQDVMSLFEAVDSVHRAIKDGAQYSFAMDCLLMQIIRITDSYRE